MVKKILLSVTIILCVFLMHTLFNAYAKDPVRVGLALFHSQLQSITNYYCDTTGMSKEEAYWIRINFYEQVIAGIEKFINSQAGFTFHDNDINNLLHCNVTIYVWEGNSPDVFHIEIVDIGTKRGIVSKPIKKYSLTQATLVNFINERIAKGLQYIDELKRVDADEVIDSLSYYTVQYRLAKESPGDILVEVKYAGDPPFLKLSGVFFSEENPKKDGESTYTITTEEGLRIFFTFWYVNNQCTQVRVDTNYPASSSVDEERVFVLKSKKGYPINFTFKWKNGELNNVAVEPRQNPYANIEKDDF